MNDRSSSPTRASAPLTPLLLTHCLHPVNPNKVGAKSHENIGSERAASPTRRRGVPCTEGTQPPVDNNEDWCLRLPQASKSALSLPPSAHISTTSSRSPSKNWIVNPETDIPYSPEFPPGDFTDLVLIPKDRDVEFHVQAATVFYESPLLGDVIRPFLSPRVECDDSEAEMDFCMLDEPYEALDAVLRFISPQVSKPTVRSITHLARLLAVCKKYEIAAGMHTLSILLIQFAGMGAFPTNRNTFVGSPIQCYGLACKFGLSNVANLISTSCLAVDPLKADLGTFLVGVATKDVRRLFDLHHSRGLAALRLVDAAIDAPEFWCKGCSGLASWYDIWREAAEKELKSKPISRTVFSPSFVAGCLKQAIKKCPSHCMDHYLAQKTQLRFAVLQKNIDSLRDRI
jgi:hypothetical protein